MLAYVNPTKRNMRKKIGFTPIRHGGKLEKINFLTMQEAEIWYVRLC